MQAIPNEWRTGLTVSAWMEHGGGSWDEELAPIRARMAEGLSEWDALEAEAAVQERAAAEAGVTIDTTRGTFVDYFRRLLGPDSVCVACGSPHALRRLCGPCEMGEALR